MKRSGRARFAILSLFVSALLIGGVLTFVFITMGGKGTKTNANGPVTDLSALTVVHVGNGILASQVVDRLSQKKANVVTSPNLPAALDSSQSTVVVFGGDWFEQNADDLALLAFLKKEADKGARLVMTGGTTSKFFEVLDKAGVRKLIVTETGVVRNPGASNFPQVGVKLEGTKGNTHPNLLFSNSDDPEVLADALTKW